MKGFAQAEAMHSAFPWKPDVPQCIILVFILNLSIVPTFTDVLYVPEEKLIPNARIVYTYYTDKLPWNKAQEACRQVHGGTLVTIDSYEVWWKINDLANNVWNSNWEHCWTGLHWSSSLQRGWIDSTCQPYEDHGAPYKDSSQTDYDPGKECYILDSGSVAFELKDCKDDFAFICQHYESDPSPQYDRIGIDLQTVVISTTTSCQMACNDVIGCFLNSQINNNTCILGILDDNADTFGKVYSYIGNEASLSTAILNLIDTLVSNVDNPEVCDENNFVDPSFASALLPVGVMNSGVEPDCSLGETAQNVISISTSTITETQTMSCAELTTTVTTIDYAVSTVQFTTTETETQSIAIACTTVQNVIYSTTNVIATTPLYVTSTMVTSLPCHTTSSNVCPSSSCQASEDLLTSFAGTRTRISATGTAIASATSTPSIPNTSASIGLIDSSQTTLTTSVSSVNVQEKYRQLTEGIVQELKVDSKTTAKALSRLNSASDSRPSAQAIGFVALTILIIFAGTIILVDIPAFVIICQSHMKNLRKMATNSNC